MNPLKALAAAYRRAPAAARVAYAGLAFFAVAALVVSWFSDAWNAFGIAIMVLVLGVLGTQAGRSRSKRLGDVVAWAIAGLAIGAAALALLVAFSGYPPAAAVLFARVFKSPAFLTAGRDTAQPHVVTDSMGLSALPEVFRSLDVSGDRFDRLRVLRSIPPLKLSGGGLSLAGPADRRTLVASKIILDDGLIQTNGGQLHIEVVDLDAQRGGRIAALKNPVAPPQAGVGAAGVDGVAGGSVTIQVHGRIFGKLGVDLSGQNGGAGGPGATGGPGSKGAKGERAASGLFDCQRGPGGGGQGSQGLAGSDGGQGGKGGNGGRLILIGDDPASLAHSVEFTSVGGRFGTGGPGGPGGPGGEGGDGGDGDGNCRGPGPTGPQGPGGGSGKAGTVGQPGATVSAPQTLTYAEAGL